MQRDPLRRWVSNNLPTVAFLGTYFTTTVVGNLIFATSWAPDLLRAIGFPAGFLDYPRTFTFGFWALLFSPFLVTPIVAAATRRAVSGWVGAYVWPEYRRSSYLVIAALCFGVVVYRFAAADVATLLGRAVDMDTSLEVRFRIRERLGFATLVALQAWLPFLTIYAVVRSIQSAEGFWRIVAIVEFFALSVLLVMLNMKWPVLLFYVSIVLTIFVFATRHAYLKGAAGAVFVFLAFLEISSLVYRLAPQPAPAPGAPPVSTGQTTDTPKSAAQHGDSTNAIGRISDSVLTTTKAASTYAPRIVMLAMNRMAISYPYYYQVFSDEGPVCGGILAQARRQPACRPSQLIYERIFHTNRTYGTDAFESRGTAPQAVHISGYALGGWPVAMLALAAGSVILGLFSAVPLDKGPASGVVTILGAVTGYHLSQIPGEGVIFYEHGLLWTLLLVAAGALVQRLAVHWRMR
jgi:hypothetical protein